MPNPFLSRSFASLAAAAVVACASAAPPPPAPPPPPPPGQSFLPQQARLVPCEAETAPPGAAEIGSRGGIVRSGRASLMVPQRALTQARRVSLAHETNDTYRIVDARIENPPGAQKANRSYILVLSYDGCDIGAGVPTVLRLDDAGPGIVEDVGGAVDPDARTVTAVLDHLSRYAIGSN